MSPVKPEPDEEEHQGNITEKGADRRAVGRQASVRELRENSAESAWGGSSSEVTAVSECWSPDTVERRSEILSKGIEEFKTQLSQSRMAKESDVGMGDLLKMMMQINSKQNEEREKREVRLAEEAKLRMEKIENDAKIREEEREERALIREEKRLQDIKNREEERRREDNLREERREARERQAREEAEEREAKLLATLKEAQPAIPQTVHLDNTKLPSMVKGEDLETFIDLFESALTVGAVPENKWVVKLHSALDTETKLSIKDTITNPDSSYEEIKQALIGQSHLTFTDASEAIMTLDQGDVTKLPMRQALQRLTRLFEKATAEATTIREACLYSAVAVARFALNTDAKQYIDVKGSFDCDNFCRSIEEWQRTHIGKPVWNSRQRPVGERQTARFTPGRKPGTCYHCGKGGHFAYECRSRLAGERQTAQPPEMPSPTQQVAARRDNRGNKPDRDLSEVTCFHCRQKGHISPNCPKNATPKIKRVLVQEDQIQVLGRNEIFGAVGPHRMPVTCDTGAEVTVVPEEAVEQDQLTGETCELRSFNDGKSVGKRCRVQISVDGTTFTKEAVTQPGKALGWSVCLSLNLTDPEGLSDATNHKEGPHETGGCLIRSPGGKRRDSCVGDSGQ